MKIIVAREWNVVVKYDHSALSSSHELMESVSPVLASGLAT